MLRAANTGVSAIIDADGIVRSSTPQFEKAVLQGEVQPMTGATPFVAYGNLLLLFSMFLFHSIGYFLLNRWPLKAKIRSLNRGLPENQ